MLLKYVILLSANPTKWSNTLKQFVGKLPMNYLSVFDLLWNWRLKGYCGNFCRGVLRTLPDIWDKVFKNGPSEICGRQPLKNLK